MRADLLNRLLDGCKFCATCTFVCMKVCVMHASGSGEPSRGICSSLVLAAKANEASFTGQHTPECDCDFYRSNLRRKKTPQISASLCSIVNKNLLVEAE